MTEYQEPMPQGKTNTLAIISLVAGILSILLALVSICLNCVGFAALLFGAGAAIMGFMGKKRIDESMGAETGRGLAMGGLITGIIGAVGGIIIIIIYLFIIGVGAAMFSLPFMEGF